MNRKKSFLIYIYVYVYLLSSKYLLQCWICLIVPPMHKEALLLKVMFAYLSIYFEEAFIIIPIPLCWD